MRLVHYARRIVVVVGVVLPAACASTGTSVGSYATRQVRGGHWTALLDAGEAALIDAGSRLERRDTAAGLITSMPIMGLAEDRAEVRRAQLSSAGDTRRVAEVRLQRIADVVSVRCKVLIQEQTTQAHRLFELDHSGYDTPTDTPIEREAATTVRQNTVWRTVRRDRRSERAILEAITSGAGDSLSPAND